MMIDNGLGRDIRAQAERDPRQVVRARQALDLSRPALGASATTA